MASGWSVVAATGFRLSAVGLVQEYGRMAFEAFYETPRVAGVYNLGGGRANSISVIEAIERLRDLTNVRLKTDYVDRPRMGDHICYISNLKRLQTDYPGWCLSRSLDDILRELVGPSRAPVGAA